MHVQESFKFKRSRVHHVLWVLLIALSTLVIVSLPISIGARLGSLILLLGYAGYHVLSPFGLISANEVTGLEYRVSSKEWRLLTQLGFIQARLRGDSVITRMALILRFDVIGSQRVVTCTIFQDSLEGDQSYRALCVQIKRDASLYGMNQIASQEIW